jgi:hypothetical protein
MPFFRFHFWILAGSILVFSGCAGYGGSDLKPGESRLADVVASMGVPAMHWQDVGGREQLAYPRGPAGTQTFMVFLAPDGRLERIEKVLDMEHFAKIEADRSDEDDVLRLLGPVASPRHETYFERRDELVWSYLFCNSWNQEAYFDVLFDATTGIVRSTQQRLNYIGMDGVAPSCGH